MFVMRRRVSEKKDGINLVVGAGLSGAVIAERIANSLDEKVVIIDKKNHLGGLVSDYVDRNGFLLSRFGTHIFHTDDKPVWDYVNSFGEFRPYIQKLSACINGIKSNVPFNLDSLYKIFPQSIAERLEYKLLRVFPYDTEVYAEDLKIHCDNDFNFLAEYIYNNLSYPLSCKFWQDSQDDLQNSGLPHYFIRISRDNRVFKEKYQGVPVKGYSDLIENMLKNHNIELCLNTDYNYMVAKNFKKIFFTGSIDDCFNYKFGMLPYRSVSFEFSDIDINFYQSDGIMLYPFEFDFAAIHEYKHYQNLNVNKTVISREYHTDFVYGENERACAILNPCNIKLYEQYLLYGKKYRNTFFLGRLGSYKNFTMAEAVKNALTLFDKVYNDETSDDFINQIVNNC